MFTIAASTDVAEARNADDRKRPQTIGAYAVVPNALMDDQRLTIGQRAVGAWLAGHPPEPSATVRGVVLHVTEGLQVSFTSAGDAVHDLMCTGWLVQA